MTEKEKNIKTAGDLAKETQEVLDDKKYSGNKIPVSMKIVIGVLVVIVLGLLGYVMYQAGKSSNDKNSELVATDEVDTNKKEVVSEIQNSTSNNESNTDDRAEIKDIISRNSISAEDLNKLDDEINGISTHYDDLEKTGTDLQKWPN
jgi:uncharacterized protein HemX